MTIREMIELCPVLMIELALSNNFFGALADNRVYLNIQLLTCIMNHHIIRNVLNNLKYDKWTLKIEVTLIQKKLH